MIRLSSRCCSRSLTATHLANVVAMALNLEVTNCPLRFARIRGINPSTGVFLATMKDLSARLEPTRPRRTSLQASALPPGRKSSEDKPSPTKRNTTRGVNQPNTERRESRMKINQPSAMDLNAVHNSTWQKEGEKQTITKTVRTKSSKGKPKRLAKTTERPPTTSPRESLSSHLR